jgi:hypothetical protein
MSDPREVLMKMRELHPDTPETVYAEREAEARETQEFLHKQRKIREVEVRRAAGLKKYREEQQQKKEVK